VYSYKTWFLEQTKEVETLRETSDDPKAWKGPAELLKLDPSDGTAIVEHQGTPYKVSLRHVRPFRGSYMVSGDALTLLTKL
jgi:hypothetical protein